MATTTTPPPPKSSGASFILLGVGMLLVMGGLIYWKVAGDKEPEAPPPEPPKVENKAPVFDDPPPPPPPPEEPKDAEAEKEEPKKVVRSSGGSGACSDPCNGTAPGSLHAALRAKGGQARGCYERALRLNPTLSGRITVAARIGAQGQVCSANVAQNTLGDSSVATCVAQMFRSGKFPAPNGGCVDVQVPLNLVPKQ